MLHGAPRVSRVSSVHAFLVCRRPRPPSQAARRVGPGSAPVPALELAGPFLVGLARASESLRRLWPRTRTSEAISKRLGRIAGGQGSAACGGAARFNTDSGNKMASCWPSLWLSRKRRQRGVGRFVAGSTRRSASDGVLKQERPMAMVNSFRFGSFQDRLAIQLHADDALINQFILAAVADAQRQIMLLARQPHLGCAARASLTCTTARCALARFCSSSPSMRTGWLYTLPVVICTVWPASAPARSAS